MTTTTVAATAAPNVHIETFAAQPDQVRVVRQWIRGILAGSPYVDDVVLLADELACNAIKHSLSGLPGGTFDVTITVADGTVRLDVTDAGNPESTPHIRHDRHASAAEDGRGLNLVAELSAKWGFNRRPGGCDTWFVLAAT